MLPVWTTRHLGLLRSPSSTKPPQPKWVCDLVSERVCDSRSACVCMCWSVDACLSVCVCVGVCSVPAVLCASNS